MQVQVLSRVTFSASLTKQNSDDVIVAPARRPYEAAYLVQASGVHVDAARKQLLGDVGVALQTRGDFVYAAKMH